jgi:hypothetical protein
MVEAKICRESALQPPRPRILKHMANMVSSTAQRAALLVFVAIAGVCLLALVAVSPLVLEQLGVLRGIDWVRLSYIGQTFGAASALLSGIALIGVTSSIIFQIRAINAASEQSSREHHLHLVEIALNDPEYLRCWGGWGIDPASYPPPERWRQHVYVNLIVSYWDRDFVVGALHERSLRAMLGALFEGEAGRQYWAVVREFRLKYPYTSRERHFCQIVDEEYGKALMAGPPAVLTSEPNHNSLNDRPEQWSQDAVIRTAGTLLLGAVGGELLKAAILRRLYR